MPQNQSLNILAHFYQKLQKTAKIEIGFYSYQDGHCFIPQVRFLNSRLIAFN